jgi:hypothetical protein
VTLILGARARDHVVLMADGLSLLTNDSGVTVNSKTLQKLFRSEKHPFAIAHHGENRLGSLPVSKVIGDDDFQRELSKVWSDGLNQTTARVIRELDDSVAQRLKGSKNREKFGLWLAGLWPCTDIPEIVEIFWHQHTPNRVRVEIKTLGDLSIGGSGIKFIREYLQKPFDEKFSVKKIFSSPAEYNMAFLKTLYSEALKRQKAADENIFGGKAWMALITKDGVDLGAV